MPRIHRRSLLRATGAGAALLPLVPLLERPARGQTAPRRLVFFYSSNGTVRERWKPTMNGAEMVMSDILKPLEPYKSETLVIDGLDYKGGWGGHEVGCVLTGAGAQKADGNNNLAKGISIDQAVANAIGTQTKFRSLECGIKVDLYANWVSALSYRGALQPIRPENSPQKIFERVFTELVPPSMTDTGGALEQLRLDRKSVIDFALRDLAALRAKVGADEQRKLDAHLENVRDIEKTLAGGGKPAGASCRAPAAPTGFDANANDNIPRTGRVQMELLLMALACDLTRVCTIQHGRGGANHRFTWLGPEFQTTADEKGDGTTGIHGLAHNETNPNARAKLVKIHAWYAGELAWFWSRLKMIPEGAGTMADNTLVVWVNELGTGNHSLKNTPWVLLGRAGGFFRTGRVLSFPGEAHAKLLVNIGQAMGLPITTFGDPALGTAPLPGLS